MAPAFDLAAIEGHRWRQGSVLGPGLFREARDRAPAGIQLRDDDWLIVTSHDCDIANGALDTRWRSKMKEWLSILQNHSGWIQGVYLRLNTLNELEEANPYLCHLLVATPAERKKDTEWADRREKLER